MNGNLSEEMYDGRSRRWWLDGLGTTSEHNGRYMMALLARLGVPASYLDVGCGDGSMVKVASRLGCPRACGIDQLVDDWEPNFFHANLGAEPFLLPDGPVDLVTSFETGEHIPLDGHEFFCDTVCNNLATGGGGKYLVFSAARPGQHGSGHIACMPAAYWHDQFSKRKVNYNDVMTANIALIFSRIDQPLNYMYDNLMVFNR